MPSQHIGTFLSQKEVQMIEETCKKAGITKYRLFKDALHEYCEGRLKEGTELDGESTRGKPERGPERDTESVGGSTEADNQRGKPKADATERSSDVQEYFDYLRATA
jgi:hypothetical protein